MMRGTPHISQPFLPMVYEFFSGVFKILGNLTVFLNYIEMIHILAFKNIATAESNNLAVYFFSLLVKCVNKLVTLETIQSPSSNLVL